MVLRPDFYRQVALDRSAERQRLGLHATQPTGLVMFGAEGASAMVQIATLLPDTPLILMCGRNVKTAARLRAMPATAPRCVVEFTPDVQHYMQLADFFIGKPGPGSLSEAVQQHLPVIVARNAWTMPQERYNATWVRETGVGLVVRSFRNIAPAVAELTGRLHEFKAATARLDIRAVFEIPEILATILARSDRLEMAVGAH
jgi:1,2-diacylglycerol 3-beta-galactosyltransferase